MIDLGMLSECEDLVVGDFNDDLMQVIYEIYFHSSSVVDSDEAEVARGSAQI